MTSSTCIFSLEQISFIYCIINTDASESGWGVHSCVASIGGASPMTTLPH